MISSVKKERKKETAKDTKKDKLSPDQFETRSRLCSLDSRLHGNDEVMQQVYCRK